ncbi:MAG: pseudouridine synthase [Hyphomicrobiaceae bacterium]
MRKNEPPRTRGEKPGRPARGAKAADASNERGERRDARRTSAPEPAKRTEKAEAAAARPARRPPKRADMRRDKRGGGDKAHAPERSAPGEPMRIAKALARAGLCSRREAERWITEGRVAVNGRVISSPALDVGATDKIVVDGKPLPDAEPPRLWRYHKPRGLVTTHRDPEGRPTVFDSVPKELGRVISIGRLDFNSEGLLLLTNDGALARHLELPSTGWLRRYRVRAFGRVVQADLDRLKEGVEVEGVHYGPVEATLDKMQGSNSWLTVAIREGKNREVRKILASIGLDVGRLIRISFGPFQLLDLQPGAVELVKRRVVVEQLGPRSARELGLADDAELRRGHGRGGATPSDDDEAA